MKEKSYNTTCYHVKNVDIPANTQHCKSALGTSSKRLGHFKDVIAMPCVSWDTLLNTHNHTYSTENWHIYEVTLFHRNKTNFTPAKNGKKKKK